MMSLRQRHIDPQLAIGSQRLVESCLLAGQQGEGTPHQPRSRAAFRPTRSQSFGHLDCLPLPPLSSAVSHPSIICSSNPGPLPVSHLSYSSSCLPSSVGGALVPHSSHMHHHSFQPMDPIPDFSFSDVSQLSHSDSLGYPFSFQFLTRITCEVCFWHPFHITVLHAYEFFSSLFFFFYHHASFFFTALFGFYGPGFDEAALCINRYLAKNKMSSRREILEKFFLLWLFCSTNQCGVACCGFCADKPSHARLMNLAL